MTARIFLKIIALVLLIMVVALTTVDFLASQLAERTYIHTLTTTMQQKVAMLAVLSRQRIIGMSHAEAHELARAAGGRLTVVAPDGRVLLDSEAEPGRMENHGHRPEVIAALKGEVGTNIRRSPTLGTDFLYVAVPGPAGAVRLAMPLAQVRGQVSEVRTSLLLYMSLAFLPAFALAAFFARYFSRRLGAIIDQASTLATGNFAVRPVKESNDELGTLARQLNETAAKLRKVFEELQREHVELEKLERIRKDFVINVSHELRTPLASVLGYTETLLDGAIHDDQNNVRFLRIIRQNAERLGRLTSDLLTLSRFELKSQRFQFASYYVASLLTDSVDSLRPVADKKSIRLEVAEIPPALEVFCDSEAVHQVLSNLLDNAIKYTPEGGAIRLSTEPRQDRVRINVTDTGMGIPPEDVPRLFERFYRVDKARSRELGGTGLGLAIVKHLVRAQGGEAGVESVLDQGSTFWFTLPMHDLGLGEHGAL